MVLLCGATTLHGLNLQLCICIAVIFTTTTVIFQKKMINYHQQIILLARALQTDMNTVTYGAHTAQGVHSTIHPPEARRKKHILGQQFQSKALQSAFVHVNRGSFVSQSRNGFTGKLSPLYHLRAENMVSINFATPIIIVYNKFVSNKSSFR